MGAKRQAKKQYEKEIELEKLRNRAAAAQQRKDLKQSMLASMTPEELAAYKKKRVKKFAIIGGVFVALMIIGSIGGNDSSSSSGTSKSSTTREFPAQIENIMVVNPATVKVFFNVKNDSSGDVQPSCTVEVKDDSGTYHGYDIFDIGEAISPGQQKNGAGIITVTKQGAAFVTKGSITCTGTTSDGSSSAGKDVKIIAVNPNKATLSDYDPDTQSWYWGVSFKVDEKPWTRLTCTQKAFDSNGKQIAEHTYPANVVNDGTVVSYGENETSMPDTTKAIAKAISDVKVSCHL
jgi:hypothetical protein